MDLLMNCLKKGTSPELVVQFAKDYLTKAGFQELHFDGTLYTRLEENYFVCPYPDVLFAFTMGSTRKAIQPVRMAFAHVDQPCFKIKHNPDFKSMGAAELNVEIYGGMTDHTWFDRPLGISGSVALRGKDAFHPDVRIYESGRPVAIIPGLAIHMKREMNEGWKINRQTELMPVVGLAGKTWTEETFVKFLAKELSVDVSEILSYELNLYNIDQPCLLGVEDALLSSPRLDNLVSVAALLESIVEGQRDDGINLIGIFNHEEVGSASKSGAHSVLLPQLLEQIFLSLGWTSEIYRASMNQSLFLSVDGAHGAHPNYTDKCDPISRAYVGKGAAIKASGTQKYASDCVMQAILKALAADYDIPLQVIQDRNTIRGGSTLGPMIATSVGARGCDIGAPMWAMHSARETMAAEDYESLCRLITAFFVS